MKKLFFLGASLWALAAPVAATAGPPAVAIVRITDNGGDVTAVITRGEGKSELLKFDGGASEKKLTQSSEGYYKLVAKLYQEGYTLQSSFVNTQYTTLTTLVFTKPQ